MTADERLAAAFALDEPPARDLGFNTAVMERVARRRLQRSLLMLAPTLLAACAVLWALGPLLVPVAEQLGQGLAPAAGIVVMVAALTVFSLKAASAPLRRAR